jgi:hypothetical protein
VGASSKLATLVVTTSGWNWPLAIRAKDIGDQSSDVSAADVQVTLRMYSAANGMTPRRCSDHTHEQMPSGAVCFNRQ